MTRDEQLRQHLSSILNACQKAHYSPGCRARIKRNALAAINLLDQPPLTRIGGDLEVYLERLRTEAEEFLGVVNARLGRGGESD